MHVDDFGHLAQGERLEVLDALLEEVALPVDDEVHDLEHRLPSLLDGLDHPVGAVHFRGDELAIFRRHLLLVAGDLLVRTAEAEPGHAGVVQEHLVAPADLLDDQVRNDVAVALVRVLEPGLGIEPRELVGRGLDRHRLDREPFRQIVPPVRDEIGERLVDQPVGERSGVGLLAELDEEALAEIARTDARRVEPLEDPPSISSTSSMV